MLIVACEVLNNGIVLLRGDCVIIAELLGEGGLELGLTYFQKLYFILQSKKTYIWYIFIVLWSIRIKGEMEKSITKVDERFLRMVDGYKYFSYLKNHFINFLKIIQISSIPKKEGSITLFNIIAGVPSKLNSFDQMY